VDEVFVSNGVNVGTGNIDYRGAVIINGDVADKMKVIAKGDIIITQGAAGQTVDNNTVPNCVIRAGGNVCIENAQGLDIICGGDLIVRKQLAFSRIVCKVNIFVGKQDKADGILIGCQISGRGEITAGVIGATSGSSISIDFTQEYNNVHRASTSLKKQYEGLQSTYTQHQQQQQFAQHLTIKATHTLHSGVYVIINKYTWESKQQFGPSKVFFVTSKWEITPLV
ncbi:MAG: FapA family protein, partial [Glaciecola sp.]